MKRRRVPVLLASLFAVFGTFAAVPVPAALADAKGVPEPDICPVAVFDVLPVATGTPATTYAAILASPQGPGRASGTLWVNTRDGAFSVPFAQRGVTNTPFTVAVDPIVFTLPRAEPLENVFVSELDDPAPGPCKIYNTWVPGIATHLRDELQERFRHALRAAPEPVAALPIADPDAVCRSGNAEASTVVAVPPRNGPTHETGRITVRVRLAADSSVLEAKVEHSEVPMHNHDALEATRASVFITQTRACRPQAAEYRFIVVYQ